MQTMPWWHSITLRPGITTAGGKDATLMALEETAIFESFDLRGLSVLDIGAWNGGFSFAAKRRGAGRVLATDSYIWEHPYWRGREGFLLARRELGLAVEDALLDPTQITTALGSFDVVLFLGVFYHLRDPIDVLQRLRSVTGQLLLLETHQDLLGTNQPGMVFYPGAELNNDATNWWGPNPALMHQLLRMVGFDRIFYRDHPTCGRGRGIFAALTAEADAKIAFEIAPPWLDLNAPNAMEML